MLSSYLPIVILLVIVAGFALTMVTVVTDMLGPRRYNRAKLDAYECGIEPTPLPAGTAGRFPIKFYLTAMLFIVFDIEIVFLYPWAQSAIPLGVLGLVEIILFIVDRRRSSTPTRGGAAGSTGTEPARFSPRNACKSGREAGQWVWKKSCPAASC